VASTHFTGNGVYQDLTILFAPSRVPPLRIPVCTRPLSLNGSLLKRQEGDGFASPDFLGRHDSSKYANSATLFVEVDSILQERLR
jgi:hypothetical protein